VHKKHNKADGCKHGKERRDADTFAPHRVDVVVRAFWLATLWHCRENDDEETWENDTDGDKDAVTEKQRS